MSEVLPTSDPPPRVLVTPRARARDSEAALPLTDLLRPLLDRQARGLILLVAPAGGGKTAALGHLRGALQMSAPIALFDEHEVSAAEIARQSGLALLVARTIDHRLSPRAVLELCPWTIDDCMEYLAATHREQCGDLLRRLACDRTMTSLAGSPQLLAMVMDRLAAGPPSLGIGDVLRRFVWDLFPPGELRQNLMEEWEYRRPDAHLTDLAFASPWLNPEQNRWWRHRSIRRTFAADWIADQLCNAGVPPVLEKMADESFVADVASATKLRPAAVDRLYCVIRDNPADPAAPMAASLLLCIDPDWRPESAVRLNLAGALLASARWAKIDLTDANLVGADIRRADLRGANLTRLKAFTAKLAGANLIGATIDAAIFREASAVGAAFTESRGSEANFQAADLTRASFARATLTGVILSEANLQSANFKQANLHGAMICRAELADTDFTSADLSCAGLEDLCMRQAVWTGASFPSARLLRCDLEDLELPEANFRDGDLTESLLTGTRILCGDFRGAILRQTGLAHIEWENADLRGADLTGASFHLGSTRCGMVGSTTPCEGSRTGFYTDDYTEQDYKPPEEVRKANLCGADLRQASTDGTDFYLVDLRGAHFSSAQAEMFAQCGAILKE